MIPMTRLPVTVYCLLPRPTTLLIYLVQAFDSASTSLPGHQNHLQKMSVHLLPTILTSLC